MRGAVKGWLFDWLFDWLTDLLTDWVEQNSDFSPSMLLLGTVCCWRNRFHWLLQNLPQNMYTMFLCGIVWRNQTRTVHQKMNENYAHQRAKHFLLFSPEWKTKNKLWSEYLVTSTVHLGWTHLVTIIIIIIRCQRVVVVVKGCCRSHRDN